MRNSKTNKFFSAHSAVTANGQDTIDSIKSVNEANKAISQVQVDTQLEKKGFDAAVQASR